MASYERHCEDSRAILGKEHEDVHRWIDELFAKYGVRHRRHRHHWRGVAEALKLFGRDGAKAAIVHIVRDCGSVPMARSYDQPKEQGIVLAPECVAFQDRLDVLESAVHSQFEEFERRFPQNGV